MKDESEHRRTVAEIRAELFEAQEYERKELEVKQKEVKPTYKFTIVPSTYSEMFSPQYCSYTLAGIVLNKEELKAVGKFPHEGGMAYAYDRIDDTFICGIGGGSSFTKDTKCWKELSAFIALNPAGGDVTEIVTKYFPKY